ncbi:hypothetical protein BS50DRAFT_626404 [Corynespora cassiicola Philippines]|uniref:Uncharacterized protein n=1 Tax=Corynespora cassiicola Philippines TaxID=1448308 RepID=A0A2T2N479_CORCC|nr:hypothetical protein BS50DRAFT_626404 [Corynespora cassiicola Philippines]
MSSLLAEDWAPFPTISPGSSRAYQLNPEVTMIPGPPSDETLSLQESPEAGFSAHAHAGVFMGAEDFVNPNHLTNNINVPHTMQPMASDLLPSVGGFNDPYSGFVGNSHGAVNNGHDSIHNGDYFASNGHGFSSSHHRLSNDCFDIVNNIPPMSGSVSQSVDSFSIGDYGSFTNSWDPPATPSRKLANGFPGIKYSPQQFGSGTNGTSSAFVANYNPFESSMRQPQFSSMGGHSGFTSSPVIPSSPVSRNLAGDGFNVDNMSDVGFVDILESGHQMNSPQRPAIGSLAFDSPSFPGSCSGLTRVALPPSTPTPIRTSGRLKARTTGEEHKGSKNNRKSVLAPKNENKIKKHEKSEKCAQFNKTQVQLKREESEDSYKVPSDTDSNNESNTSRKITKGVRRNGKRLAKDVKRISNDRNNTRKQRAPRPPLVRWTEQDWMRATIGIIWACGEDGISIPFDRAATFVSPTCTAGALQQAVLKLHSKLRSQALNIPVVKMHWSRRNQNRPVEGPNIFTKAYNEDTNGCFVYDSSGELCGSSVYGDSDAE